MIKANNIKTDIIKGNFESKILLTSVNNTIPPGNLDIQVLYCTRNSILNSEYRIDHTRKLVTVLNNESKQMIENISTYITNYKVEHDTFISFNKTIHSHSSEANALVYILFKIVLQNTTILIVLNKRLLNINLNWLLFFVILSLLLKNTLSII